MPKSAIVGFCGNYIFNFTRSCHALSRMALPLYISTSNVWVVQFLQNLTSIWWCYYFFFYFSHLLGAQWHAIVILISIFLMTNFKNLDLFMCTLPHTWFHAHYVYMLGIVSCSFYFLLFSLFTPIFLFHPPHCHPPLPWECLLKHTHYLPLFILQNVIIQYTLLC